MVNVPRPGVIGIFVDIGLTVGGFVDVALLPDQGEDRPAEGTIAEFEISRADSRQPTADSRSGRQLAGSAAVDWLDGALDNGEFTLDEHRGGLVRVADGSQIGRPAHRSTSPRRAAEEAPGQRGVRRSTTDFLSAAISSVERGARTYARCPAAEVRRPVGAAAQAHPVPRPLAYLSTLPGAGRLGRCRWGSCVSTPTAWWSPPQAWGFVFRGPASIAVTRGPRAGTSGLQ